MRKWLTTRTYNRIDVAWIALVTLALNDGRVLAAVGIAIVGAVITSAIEVWAAGQEVPDGGR